MSENALHAELASCLNVGHGAVDRAIKNLSPGQLLKIPAGFKNNVLWNVGHIPVILSLLVCKPTESEPLVPKSFEGWFKNGTSPADWKVAPDHQGVIEVFRASVPKVQEALLSGQLDHFQAFELFPGYTIGSAEHALAFHSFHNGIHLGTINALKKFL